MKHMILIMRKVDLSNAGQLSVMDSIQAKHIVVTVGHTPHKYQSNQIKIKSQGYHTSLLLPDGVQGTCDPTL